MEERRAVWTGGTKNAATVRQRSGRLVPDRAVQPIIGMHRGAPLRPQRQAARAGDEGVGPASDDHIAVAVEAGDVDDYAAAVEGERTGLAARGASATHEAEATRDSLPQRSPQPRELLVNVVTGLAGQPDAAALAHG